LAFGRVEDTKPVQKIDFTYELQCFFFNIKIYSSIGITSFRSRSIQKTNSYHVYKLIKLESTVLPSQYHEVFKVKIFVSTHPVHLFMLPKLFIYINFIMPTALAPVDEMKRLVVYTLGTSRNPSKC
jgi:hypothetical protein